MSIDYYSYASVILPCPNCVSFLSRSIQQFCAL